MAETRMTKKEREKRRRVLLWIFLPLVVLLLVFSGLVTISEQMNRPFLPPGSGSSKRRDCGMRRPCLIWKGSCASTSSRWATRTPS